MRVGSGVILFQLAGFLTSALADFYFAKHKEPWYLLKVKPLRLKQQLKIKIMK